MKTQHGILPAMVLMGLMSATVRATDYFVSLNGGNQPPYTNWTMAATNLNAAAAWANTNNVGDTVWISNGTHFITATVPVSNIVVRGFDGNRTNVVVNGGNAVRCFAVNHSNALINALTISNGNSGAAAGGGVSLLNGMLSNCMVSYCKGTNGGGVYVTNGILSNCKINNNSATGTGGGCGVYMDRGGEVRDGCLVTANNTSLANTAGGGIRAYYGGIIRDSTISFNMPGAPPNPTFGGGLHLDYGGLITNCTINDNRGHYGAAVRISSSGPALGQVWNCLIYSNYGYNVGAVYGYCGGTIANCVIRDNTANGSTEGGGGVYAQRNTLIQNCLIYRNKANGSLAGAGGGGIYAYADNTAGTNIIRSCTVASNSAYAGGGIKLVYTSLNMTNVLVNSIVYNNYASNGISHDVFNYNAPTNGNQVSYSCMSDTNGFTGAGNFTNDPRFVSPVSTNYRLAGGSPCIDRGINEAWMNGAVDPDTNSRVFHNRTDIGAYEFRFRGAIFSIH